ncbi:PREDICTED: adenosine receptor A1-like [Priapulus caudatus]|uniref:Adenosine receptor A1-like n=1 Tax=Priapulus caudatus TaxID=37621 RepID=A0ABM1DQC3_PRICU|nr:PREDICTED: adenosine receptor A1-like [Priapulus caudatus]
MTLLQSSQHGDAEMGIKVQCTKPEGLAEQNTSTRHFEVLVDIESSQFTNYLFQEKEKCKGREYVAEGPLIERKYHGVMTVRKAVSMMVAAWVLAFFIGLLPRVYFSLLQIRQIAVQELVLAFNGGGDAADDAASQVRSSLWKREVRAAKSLFFIIIFFFVCWYPLHILDAIMAFTDIEFPIQLLNVLVYLSHANSAINPFLYAFASGEFRAAFRSIFAVWFPRCCKASPEDKNQMEATSMQRHDR